LLRSEDPRSGNRLTARCMPSISLSAVLNPEESGGYVALCPELDIASQGESI